MVELAKMLVVATMLASGDVALMAKMQPALLPALLPPLALPPSPP